MEYPILITGVERSGSGLIARIIEHAGAFTGPLTEMKENKKIKLLVDDYYHVRGISPKGQYPLPHSDSITVGWKDKVQSCLVADGYDKGPWVYKSSRISQMWRTWEYAFPTAKWIIVRRRTGDIIQSCLKTGYMQAYADKEVQKEIGVTSEHEGWLWWIHEHEKNFVDIIEAGNNVKVIWPERMVTGDYSQIYEMLEWLGLKWDNSIVTMIDPLLEKNRR